MFNYYDLKKEKEEDKKKKRKKKKKKKKKTCSTIKSIESATDCST